MGLCSALSWPPTLPIVIKLLLFVCSLFFMLKGSFGAFQLVFVLAAASVRLHRKKIFGRNKERQKNICRYGINQRLRFWFKLNIRLMMTI